MTSVPKRARGGATGAAGTALAGRRGGADIGELLRSLVEYLFVIVVTLDTNTIWIRIDGSSLDKLLNIALIFVVLAYFLVCDGTATAKAFHSIVVALIVGAAYWLLYALLSGYNVVSFAYLVIDAFAIYTFVMIAKDRHRGSGVLLKYRNLIFVVAVVSLFFWVFGSQLGVIQPTGTVYSTWTGTSGTVKAVPSYYGVYFEHQSLTGTMLGITIDTARNTAVFTEAPMSSLHFCIALILELFYSPRLSKARCALLVAAVLSTFSTTGWCLVVIAFAVKYVFGKGTSEIATAVKAVVVPVLAIVAFIVLLSLVQSKLDTGSGESRARDFVTGFKAFLESPLIGYGYNSSLYYQNVKYGYCNSITPILGYGGLFLAAPYLFCIIKWVSTCLKERDLQKFLLFACFLFMFAITIIAFRFLTIFLLFAYHFPREGAAPPSADGQAGAD